MIFQFLINDTVVFGAELVINNLEVDLVAALSVAVHYGVVGCNLILVLLGLKRGDKDDVGFAMIGGQDVLITAVRLYGEVPSIVCVEL